MRTDPVELELMRNLFESAAEEMGITLQRVSFSANIKERRDFSCALFDADGDLLAQAAHIPVHLGSMPASVRAVTTRLGPLEEGDVAIVNDPYAGGTHLPDITLVTPIDVDGVRVGYAGNRAHHADVGGATPGSMTPSRHIDEEGVRIEPSLLYRRGRRDETLLNGFLARVRNPDERLGDLDAQIAANAVASAALSRMVRRRGAGGADVVRRCGKALLEYARSFMSRAIAAIPDGVYAFEDVLDDDGAGTFDIPVRVTLTIAGDQATADFRDSADQVPGCVNCPEAVAHSAVYYCFACLLGRNVPLNAGCFRDICVLTRPGSVVHATYPAAVVAGNTETSQRVVDVVFGALARAIPGRIPAASCGTMSSLALGSSRWTYYETIPGGSGAGPGFAGTHAVQCHMTNTLNTPAEALELQYPLRVLRFERAHDTGGPGEFPGGDGVVREIQVLDACEGTLLSDRRRSRPYGAAGGSPGRPGADTVLAADGTEQPLPPKGRFHLAPGEVLRIRTPGGGGFGREGGRRSLPGI